MGPWNRSLLPGHSIYESCLKGKKSTYVFIAFHNCLGGKIGNSLNDLNDTCVLN